MGPARTRGLVIVSHLSALRHRGNGVSYGVYLGKTFSRWWNPSIMTLNESSLGGDRPKPGEPIPDEETGQFGDADDPGLESDEDIDGEQDAGGGQPLHG